MRPTELLTVTPQGLYCPPADLWIDPVRPVPRALITHGHADHARAGHGKVLATAPTLAIMAARYGEGFTTERQVAEIGRETTVDGVGFTFFPAGHVLGSAQIRVRWKGLTIVASGDYKRERDPTAAPFEVVPCDVFHHRGDFRPAGVSVIRRRLARSRNSCGPCSCLRIARIWSGPIRWARRNG